MPAINLDDYLRVVIEGPPSRGYDLFAIYLESKDQF